MSEKKKPCPGHPIGIGAGKYAFRPNGWRTRRGVGREFFFLIDSGIEGCVGAFCKEPPSGYGIKTTGISQNELLRGRRHFLLAEIDETGAFFGVFGG